MEKPGAAHADVGGSDERADCGLLARSDLKMTLWRLVDTRPSPAANPSG